MVSVLRSEVGRPDLGVLLNLRRRAFGEVGAKFHHHNVVANVHDQIHVMLHQQDAHPFGLQLPQDTGEFALFAVTQAGGTIGQVEVSPGTSATRVATWIDVGTTDVQIFILSTNTGAGVGAIVVNYMQALNLTP